uniref:Broad-complex core protein isoform 6 n=2 Tax=Zeugodacus cucurbitae TaxID=28588 RepID=A0A0A1WL01_ZEUCU
MDPQQQFCLKWNSYSSNLAITFSNLFKSDVLADVTLSCDGRVFKAHKLILAACSKKFAELFESTPTNGQCVVILEATSSDNMAALLEFMYKGEVHVSQEALNSFLKSAENLQVKGLSTETGRLAAQQAQQHIDASPLDSPTGRRSMRNSLSGAGSSGIGSAVSSIGGGIPSGAIIGGNMAAAMAERISNSGNGSVSGGSGNGCAGSNIISGPGSAHCNATASGAGGACGGAGGGSGGMGSGAGVAHHLSSSSGNLKQECDSLMQSSTAAALAGGIPPYVPPIYRPISFEPPRKRVLRSPYAEHEVRGSVLRDGSKNSSSECASPISKPPYHRPSSSASSNAPTEADTMQSERTSPSRYENHSPGATPGNGNVPSNLSGSLERTVKTERNNGSTHEANDDDQSEHDESIDNGAEDLRVKLENSNYSPPPPQPPTSNASSTTPSALLENLKHVEAGLPSNLATSIAPEDMLNVWNATKLNNKNSGMVNTADGKKLKCLYCDRLYGYETNLRAHIRQRHQGIRVHCPFCSRTFTRNNTVRRHIAREHKQEIGMNVVTGGIVPASVVTAATAATANHSQ